MGFEQGHEPKFSEVQVLSCALYEHTVFTIYIQELDKWNTPVKWRNQMQQGKGLSTGLTRCFCQIQQSLHCQGQWAKWDPPRDQGGGTWGGLHGLSGQEEQKRLPVKPRGEQKQQWPCSLSFLDAVVFLVAGSTKPDQAYSNTSLGPRAECKSLKSQTNALAITPSFLSKDTDFSLVLLY